jgi:hypothetical protein
MTNPAPLQAGTGRVSPLGFGITSLREMSLH